MPVIAINVTKKVYDAYHSIKKGKRSERMNNALERHFRLEGNSEFNEMDKFNLQLKIKEMEENILKLQTRLTDSLAAKSNLELLCLKQQEYLNHSWLSNILHRRHRP